VFTRVGSWSSRARRDARYDERTAAILGLALGGCFALCFVTGIYSHLAQHPTAWFHLPAQPAGLYRITQGLHVATGIASVPLLLAKLWSVYPKLFAWPPVRDVAHAIERLALVPLVAGAVFLLFSGIANIDLWYPLPLFFPAGHYWVAWLTIGALIVHVAAKWTVTRRVVLTRHPEPPPSIGDRRGFLLTAITGSALLTALTVGETVGWLQRAALLAPRSPTIGDQGFPVNGAAAEAGVVEAATDPAWRLHVTGNVARPIELSRDQLAAMAQRDAVLPIACVEGWSFSRRWSGVALVDLLGLVGAPPDASVTVRSLENGLYAQSNIDTAQAHDPATLLALRADGESLSLDHGFPVRLVGPNRPGVEQTKWLSRIEVT
jgi:hypothetical protein